VVVYGTAEVSVNNEVCSVHENESIYIPIGALANPGKIPLELIEVQVAAILAFHRKGRAEARGQGNSRAN
jgi:mannose-1-phosphate guanylyltransferase/mannose-6-phosphate isomerase